MALSRPKAGTTDAEMRIARTARDHRSPQKWIMIGMMADPRAMAPMSAVSRAPNTRPITSSSVLRWRIVEAFTSTTGFATPMMNMARKAAHICGQIAASSRGRAQKMTPTPKSVPSLPIDDRPTATSPPRSAPTPMTLSR